MGHELNLSWNLIIPSHVVPGARPYFMINCDMEIEFILECWWSVLWAVVVVTVLLEDLLLSDTEPDTRSRVGQTTRAGNEPSRWLKFYNNSFVTISFTRWPSPCWKPTSAFLQLIRDGQVSVWVNAMPFSTQISCLTFQAYQPFSIVRSSPWYLAKAKFSFQL